MKATQKAHIYGISYGVVPKGLLTFLGSFYTEVAKTYSETLVYCFERQIAKIYIYFFLPKTLKFDLWNLQMAAFCVLMSYFVESKLKKISIDSDV